MSETTAYTDFRLHANRLAETGQRGQAEAAVRRDLFRVPVAAPGP